MHDATEKLTLPCIDLCLTRVLESGCRLEANRALSQEGDLCLMGYQLSGGVATARNVPSGSRCTRPLALRSRRA